MIGPVVNPNMIQHSKLETACQGFAGRCGGNLSHQLNPIQPSFSGFLWVGRGILSIQPPTENNVTVKLGQWSFLKTTPVPNLVVIS